MCCQSSHNFTELILVGLNCCLRSSPTTLSHVVFIPPTGLFQLGSLVNIRACCSASLSFVGHVSTPFKSTWLDNGGQVVKSGSLHHPFVGHSKGVADSSSLSR